MPNVHVTSSRRREVLAIFAVSLWAAAAHGQPLIVGNNAAFGGGPITTYDFATGDIVNTFVPTGASDNNNGRGLLVLGNRVYYSELSAGFGPTDFIRIAPFNGGAGAADVATLPNPRPDTGIQDLAVSNGVIYVLTGYPFDPPLQVFGLDPVSGAVVRGPVSIAGSARSDADGFTVLPNGNFLINDGDQACAYNQYDSSTGALIPDTTIVVPNARICTGVETNGASLFFQTDFSSLTETDLSGVLIKNQPVPADIVEDISLVTLGCAGTPGEPSCHGRCVSSLAHTYGGIDHAASALGYQSVAELQSAIRVFCGH